MLEINRVVLRHALKRCGKALRTVHEIEWYFRVYGDNTVTVRQLQDLVDSLSDTYELIGALKLQLIDAHTKKITRASKRRLHNE